MKNSLLTVFIFSVITTNVFAQANCSSPKQLTICPAATLSGETNAGMFDDDPAAFNNTGEDVVYEITTPSNASYIYVSISGATGSYHLYMLANLCNVGIPLAYYSLPGNANFTFNVPPSTHYFLFLDAASTITYDISIGGITGWTNVNIPNTQGNFGLMATACASPPFSSVKPFCQVKYNGVYMTNPMTLPSLFVPGDLCITTYLKNTTGVEGVKQISFEFMNAGFSNVIPPPTTPGFYNTGNWVVSGGLNRYTLTFVDSAGTGKGDFTGSPNSCLKYEFCFTVTPLSNNPSATTVIVQGSGDGFGAGFIGAVPVGCCPQLNQSCLGMSGSGFGSAHGFAYAFDDPGSTLPIELTNFEARMIDDEVSLDWQTATETNNDFFTVEKSKDIEQWRIVDEIKGAGNSSTMISYHCSDKNPLSGVSYYRLVQTDLDGQSTYSKTVSVKNNKAYSANVYPNPVKDHMIIETNGKEIVEISLYNMLGEKIIAPYVTESDGVVVNTSQLEAGIYFVIIKEENFETENIRVLVY